MGVQINFYLDDARQRELIKYIYECGYKIMDCMSADDRPVVYESYDKAADIDRPWYIFDPADMSNIFIKPWGQIDPLNSCIIEFIPTSVHDGKISSGRIWLEKYVYVNEEKMLKNPSLVDMYNTLCKWVKKNTKYTLIGQRKQYVTDKIIDLTAEGYILT